MTFPRSRNGWTDDGSPLKGTIGQTCYNCGSDRYTQTLSMEHCPDCGLVVDYWSSGPNEVYLAYKRRMADQHDC
jgi:hypothetical protein